jgi:16S rRNA (uracil1498-N3)-methyltransferase
MHRFYVPPELCSAAEIILTGREAHHATHVLRLRRNETITILDGAGTFIEAEVTESDRDELKLRVLRRVSGNALPCKVTLLQAIPKGKLMESIVQKATELGVFRIVPIQSERVVRLLDKGHAGKETAKLRTVAIEAIKQCGCPWLPVVEEPVTVEDYLSRSKQSDLSLVASLMERDRHPGDWFRVYSEEKKALPRSVSVWIGPEGDFSPRELEAIQAGSARPITLGPFVLRSETAAIYAVSIINYVAQIGSRAQASV